MMAEVACQIEYRRKWFGWISVAFGLGLAVWLMGYVAQTVTSNGFILEANQGTVEANAAVIDRAVMQLNSMQDTVLLVATIHEDEGPDDDVLIISWPKSLRNLLGWTAKEATDLGLCAILPSICGECKSIVLKHTALGATRVSLSKANHKDGHKVPVKVTTWSRGDGVTTVVNSIVTEAPI